MDEWVWSNGGMALTGENWSTGRKTLYSVGGRWMNECGAMVQWYWQGNTEVLGENHYSAWVVDGRMGMEQWWNDTDRRKLKYWEKNLSPCHFAHHKSQWNGSQPLTARRMPHLRNTSTKNQRVTPYWQVLSNNEKLREISLMLNW